MSDSGDRLPRRPGRIRSDSGAKPKSFINQVLKRREEGGAYGGAHAAQR
jgi:hypothetical protein